MRACSRDICRTISFKLETAGQILLLLLPRNGHAVAEYIQRIASLFLFRIKAAKCHQF